MASIHILVADDYKAWRNQIRLLLQARPEWQVVCEVSDGSEAVQKAEELKPDLVLLDIGLPKLNGIEAARRIRKLSPDSKVVFISLDSSPDVVQIVLSTDAHGYVNKARVQNDLLPAIDAVLQGKQFVSSVLKSPRLTHTARAKGRHEAVFYSDDAVFLDSLTRFVVGALEVGDVVIVIATESHRESLVRRLKAQGLDIDAAIRQGTYLSLDGAKTLAKFMVNGLPDPARFFEASHDLVRTAAKAGKKDHPRVAVCGECGFLLWAEGNADAAIQLERLWGQLATACEVYSLCGYALSSFHGGEDEHVFQSICVEHSAVYPQ